MKMPGPDGSLAEEGGDRPVETVSQFTRRVKLVLESGIRPGWVRGEISNLRIQTSGHVYFSLKDAGAQLSAVMFRGDAARQTVKLRDGLQVVVYGEVSVYEARGQYQLIVRAVVDDGVGRLQREFEALKRRLEGEGLFDPQRKRAVPAMPATIGFVTSPTGAAVQDFINILKRRGWRGRLVVIPAKVQGEGAAAEMTAQLARAEAMGIFDLLVIGRGGGSLEDLWAFNEEVLVRAVAACRIPIISAVGHQIDFTLCDFAADVRAETPSAAAELISSSYLDQWQRLAGAAEALERHVRDGHADAREQARGLRQRLRLLSPAGQVDQGWLRLDDLRNRHAAALQHAVQQARHRLQEARSLLVQRTPATRVQIESHRLLSLWKRLQAASPVSVLNRGFVMIEDASGRPVSRAVEVKSGQRLRAVFADGAKPVTADQAADGSGG